MIFLSSRFVSHYFKIFMQKTTIGRTQTTAIQLHCHRAAQAMLTKFKGGHVLHATHDLDLVYICVKLFFNPFINNYVKREHTEGQMDGVITLIHSNLELCIHCSYRKPYWNQLLVSAYHICKAYFMFFIFSVLQNS